MISWPGAVRLVRAETLSLKNREYVALARVAGASNARIMVRHILPGVVNIVIVTATLGTGNIILLEASLSYLGAGIPPPEPSWGRMISEERQYIDAAWWTSLFPGLGDRDGCDVRQLPRRLVPGTAWIRRCGSCDFGSPIGGVARFFLLHVAGPKPSSGPD